MANRNVILHPGDFYFTQEKVNMQTILGSCIAIVFWHPKYKLGGMCHFVLPKQSNAEQELINGRFAEDAFEMFRLAIIQHHTLAKDYEVSVFGGSIMNTATPDKEQCIGELNSCLTEQLIKELKLNVKKYDLRGDKARRLSFDTTTGKVTTKYL